MHKTSVLQHLNMVQMTNSQRWFSTKWSEISKFSSVSELYGMISCMFIALQLALGRATDFCKSQHLFSTLEYCFTLLSYKGRKVKGHWSMSGAGGAGLWGQVFPPPKLAPPPTFSPLVWNTLLWNTFLSEIITCRTQLAHLEKYFTPSLACPSSIIFLVLPPHRSVADYMLGLQKVPRLIPSISK